MKLSGKIVLGNWKMNGSLRLIQDYFSTLRTNAVQVSNCTVGLAVPFPYLPSVRLELQEFNWLLGAQDSSQFIDSGAYTGEVNVAMLQDFNTRFVLVGHSERRLYFNENNILLAQKIKNLLVANITPVFCLGETLEEKEKGLSEQVLSQQLEALSGIKLTNMVIAYEPVWAIGTGNIPMLQEIKKSLAYIRTQILSRYLEADRIPLLYGGSVGVDNAGAISSVEYVDGLLVGGASLKPLDFIKIVQSVSV